MPVNIQENNIPNNSINSINADEIANQVKQALAQTLKLNSTENLKLDTKLKEELGLDSMSSLTFLMTLEDLIPNFKVDPETLETGHLENISNIINYIANEVAK